MSPLCLLPALCIALASLTSGTRQLCRNKGSCVAVLSLCQGFGCLVKGILQRLILLGVKVVQLP